MPRILCAVLLLCLLSGCSGSGLNEKTVRKVVNAYFEKEIAADTVKLGKVSQTCAFDKDEKLAYDLNPDHDTEILIAKMGGYVAATPDGPGFWQVSLTDKGKNAPNGESPEYSHEQNTLNGCNFHNYRIALAHPEVTQVGEIVQKDDAYITTFSWKWVPTEFGKELGKNGAIFTRLTPEQVHDMRTGFSGPHMSAHLPIGEEENKLAARFTKGTDGQWTFQVHDAD